MARYFAPKTVATRYHGLVVETFKAGQGAMPTTADVVLVIPAGTPRGLVFVAIITLSVQEPSAEAGNIAELLADPRIARRCLGGAA